MPAFYLVHLRKVWGRIAAILHYHVIIITLRVLFLIGITRVIEKCECSWRLIHTPINFLPTIFHGKKFLTIYKPTRKFFTFLWNQSWCELFSFFSFKNFINFEFSSVEFPFYSLCGKSAGVLLWLTPSHHRFNFYSLIVICHWKWNLGDVGGSPYLLFQ